MDRMLAQVGGMGKRFGGALWVRFSFYAGRFGPRFAAWFPTWRQNEDPGMITLYGCYRSRATRPLWALFETGLAFDHVPVIQAYRLPNPAAADAPVNTGSASFLAVNPMGQIPALVDGDLVLTESLGITLHIARRAGGSIAPASDGEAALMEQWALFAISAVETPALEIAYAAADAAANGTEAEAIIAVSAEKLRRPFARLEKELQGKDWLMAGRFTAADIVVEECVRYAQGHPALFDEFPNVKAWVARCQARPAFQKMWAGRLAEPA
jgi:glutathione S-transferase